MYYITVEWFFYENTFSTKENGPLHNGDLMTFESKEKALLYAKKQFGDLFHLKNNSYFPAGTYYLAYGEYDRPTIKIKKLRTR